jgi:hypothetical protein
MPEDKAKTQMIRLGGIPSCRSHARANRLASRRSMISIETEKVKL